MKLFYLIIFILPQLAYSNPHITAILSDANDRFEVGHNFGNTYDDFDEQIEYEIEKWKAPKAEQRHFWREVIMQTHYHAFFKSYALEKWREASEESSYSMKDFEHIMVQAHNEYISIKKEVESSKAENELKISELEHWSYVIDRLRNLIGNYCEDHLPNHQKRKKEVEELEKIFRIQIDKSLHFKVLQNA